MALSGVNNVPRASMTVTVRGGIVSGTVFNPLVQPVSGARVLEAAYTRPYQLHGAIGPSCAVARYDNGTLTIWSHGQGMYPLRGAVAELVGLPVERVHCIHMEGAGCYGHNGADDVAGDANFDPVDDATT